MEVVQQDCLEWLQELILEAEILSLFDLQEILGELSQGVDRVDGHVEVAVGAHVSEVVANL